MPGMEITQKLLDPGRRFIKRAFDLTVSLVTVPVWGTLFGVFALLVWLEDRHSPFFNQERFGAGGRVFKIWKFRTMVPNAEAVLREKLDADESLQCEWAENRKLRNDPRVTRIGGFLRRSSLDELPQLLNVLRGEMS